MDARAARCENVKMAPVKKELRPLKRTFLKEWRDHAGMDQETAAARIDISRTLLSKIETAKSPYSQRIMEAAAEIYGCTPAQLIAVNPLDPESLWPLWERAEAASPFKRKQIKKLVQIGLNETEDA